MQLVRGENLGLAAPDHL